MPSQDGAIGTSRERGWALKVVVAGLALVLGLARPGAAAVVECASGDVACLIAAINAANASGGASTIRLQAGTYTLTAPNNVSVTDGPNGLPSITSPLTIVGAGAGTTIIERAATAPAFRLLHVAQTGLLKLEGATVRGGLNGDAFSAAPGGAGLFNRGTAMISASVFTGNANRGGGPTGGGGILNVGRLVIAGSIISKNFASVSFGGGIDSRGDLTIVNSTVSGNIAEEGGGVFATDMTVIIGSTFVGNQAGDSFGGGLNSASKALVVFNTTFAGNGSFAGGGGVYLQGGLILSSTIANNTGPGNIRNLIGPAALHNTIVGPPSFPPLTACAAPGASLGNNLFVDSSCAVALLSDDLVSDPQLGQFTDDGTPGHGFLPLLASSPALDAGDNAACLPTDQLGRLRRGRSCDIGAIEGVGKAQRHGDRD
jgi:hypothetical protein